MKVGGYVIMVVAGKPLLHNFILGRKQVDHRDGDTLNNTRENLRPFFHKGQNAWNSRKTSSPTDSKYKGVKRNGKNWKADIRYKGKSINLGTYEAELEAAHAYDSAALFLFGEYARPNFPETAKPESPEALLRRVKGTYSLRRASKNTGVSRSHRANAPKPWVARVGRRINGKYQKIHIGVFATESEAVEARKRYIGALFGNASESVIPAGGTEIGVPDPTPNHSG